MILARLILPVFLIGYASCGLTPLPVDPTDVVKLVQDGIDAADKALDLYDKVLDHIIPWKEFEDTVKELDKYRDDYSKESGALIGGIQTLLLNALDDYFFATESIFEWCGTTIYQLKLYLKLFEEEDTTEAFGMQRTLLLQVLDKGITKMDEAKVKLGQSFSSLNNATGQITTLNSQLKSDFDKNSEYYQGQIKKIRTHAYAGAASGAILGIFGLMIAYGTAAAIVEGQLIPELNAKMDVIKVFYNDLEKTLDKTKVDIETTKSQLTKEIQNIRELKETTENTKSTIPMDKMVTFRKIVTQSVNDLITHCQKYREKHSGKNASR